MAVSITVTLRDDDGPATEAKYFPGTETLQPWVTVTGGGITFHVVSATAAEEWRDAFQRVADLFAEKAAIHALAEAELEEKERNRPLKEPDASVVW